MDGEKFNFYSVAPDNQIQDFAGTAVSEGITQHALDVLQEAKREDLQFIVDDATYRLGYLNSLVPAIVAVDPATNPKDLRIVDEETFGPSTSLYIVDIDEQAVNLANRSALGLNAAINTSNMTRGMQLGREQIEGVMSGPVERERDCSHY
jgi:acyl-CoA reductase-like NAD-dependent aldehyde dehydrogenase